MFCSCSSLRSLKATESCSFRHCIITPRDEQYSYGVRNNEAVQMSELCTTALSSLQVKSQELKDLSLFFARCTARTVPRANSRSDSSLQNIFTALYGHYSVTLLHSSSNIVGCFSLDSIILHGSHAATFCSLNCLRRVWFIHLNVP